MLTKRKIKARISAKIRSKIQSKVEAKIKAKIKSKIRSAVIAKVSDAIDPYAMHAYQNLKCIKRLRLEKVYKA